MVVKRIIAGFSGNLFFQAISAIIQIFGVPLCLTYWGASYYGEWLLLFTIPGYLSISDFGLGTSSSSEMAIMEQNNRRNEIPKLLRSVFWFIVIWSLIPFGILLASNYAWSWYGWLKLSFIKETEFKATFPLLILYIYLSLFLTVPLNYYRVIKKYYIERYISAAYKVFEFLMLMILVMNEYGVFAVALGYLLLRIIYFIYLVIDLYRRSEQFRLWPITIKFSEVKRIFQPGVSGLLFMLGGSLLNQGLSTIVGLNFGPQKLVMFNTVRMLVNITKQMVGIINLSVFSEFSYAYGAGHWSLLRKLFRVSLTVNILLSTVTSVGLFFLSDILVDWWTNGAVMMDTTFTTLFIVYAFLGIISTVSITLLSATNHYRNTGIVYLILILGVVSINAVWVGSLGLPFMAVTLILSELVFFLLSFQVVANILDTGWSQMINDFSIRDVLPSKVRQNWKQLPDQHES